MGKAAHFALNSSLLAWGYRPRRDWPVRCKVALLTVSAAANTDQEDHQDDADNSPLILILYSLL